MAYRPSKEGHIKYIGGHPPVEGAVQNIGEHGTVGFLYLLTFFVRFIWGGKTYGY